MSRKRPTRICATEGCGATIGTQGKTGMCRPCAIAANHADPAYRERLRAGQRRFLADDAAVQARDAARNAGAARYRECMTREQRQKVKAHGQWLYRTHASRPEVFARSQTPEARARAAAQCSETVLSWCPLDRRKEYKRLVLRRIAAAEARRIIEADIPGTHEHAQREIANIELAARMRRERDQQDAY